MLHPGSGFGVLGSVFKSFGFRGGGGGCGCSGFRVFRGFGGLGGLEGLGGLNFKGVRAFRPSGLGRDCSKHRVHTQHPPLRGISPREDPQYPFPSTLTPF